MQVSTAQDAILKRIGRTLVELNVELTIQPLPEPMLRLLDQSPAHHPHETNILCKLVEALTHPERYRLLERNGELVLQPVQPN